MASSDNNFGVDLLLESQKANIRNGNDVLVILCHWILCRNNLRNVGVGGNTEISEDDRASELLPEGWNEGETYKLRYTFNKKLYILHCNDIEGSFFLNLLDKTTLNTASLVIDTSKAVKSIKGATLSDFVHDHEALIKRITDEVVNTIIKKPQEEKPATTTESNPLLVQPHRGILEDPYAFRSDRDHYRNPFGDVGRGDLDPFGRGGGMLFQPPFHPHQPIPPFGFHPPGARFDPPNPLGRRADPDNDIFRPPPGNAPPGYDDMFM